MGGGNGHDTSLWGAVGGSVSMGVEEVVLICLVDGGLTMVGGGPRKGKKLPSFLEGAALWGGMVCGEDQPEKLKVCCVIQERVVTVACWKVWCTLHAREGLGSRTVLLGVGGGPTCRVT